MNFDEVFAQTKGLVWTLVSRYVFTKEDREDLFQEVFLNVHKALPKFRGDSSINTWIYRIAVNAGINFAKKQGRYKWLKQLLHIQRNEEHQDTTEGQDQALLPLEKLNPRQRMILLLSDIEERKLEEISKMLKIPVGTVKSNLHRAREIVRKEVEKDGKL